MDFSGKFLLRLGTWEEVPEIDRRGDWWRWGKDILLEWAHRLLKLQPGLLAEGF
jgi:hypothetical protein